MKKVLQLTAIIERKGNDYVATCPEVDVVSQGKTVEEARRQPHHYAEKRGQYNYHCSRARSRRAKNRHALRHHTTIGFAAITT